MATGDLTTVEAVKDYLGLKISDDDGKLQSLVSAVSAWVKLYTSRDLLSQAYTEIRDGRGETSFIFGDYPVTAVTSVVVGNAAAGGTTALVYGTQYLWNADRVALIDGSRFPVGLMNVTVAYQAGYLTTAIPLELAQSVVETVAYRYKERDRIGMSSKGAQGETTSYKVVPAPPQAMLVFDQYKKVVPL